MNIRKLIPKIFFSKVFLTIILAGLIFTGVVEYRKWQERRTVDKEIESLLADQNELSEQNQKLEQSIKFLSSAEYQEKLARLQLNLKKDGEIVVNFPADPEEKSKALVSDNKLNIIKWWEYIFVN